MVDAPEHLMPVLSCMVTHGVTQHDWATISMCEGKDVSVACICAGEGRRGEESCVHRAGATLLSGMSLGDCRWWCRRPSRTGPTDALSTGATAWALLQSCSRQSPNCRYRVRELCCHHDVTLGTTPIQASACAQAKSRSEVLQEGTCRELQN